MGDHEIEKDRSKRAQRRQAEARKKERREAEYEPVEHGHNYRQRLTRFWQGDELAAD